MAYKVFLSPSHQYKNRCALGDSEMDHCVELAQKLAILLSQNGIESRLRNQSAISESKAFGSDLHIPMHTNAASGHKAQGARFGYYPGRADSQKACEVFRDNFKKIYPFPDKVKSCAYTFGEAKNPECPVVYCETVFHDNKDDAEWFHANMDAIAQNFTESIIQLLGEDEVDLVGKLMKVQTSKDEGLSLWSDIAKTSRIIRVAKGEVIRVIADLTGWVLAEYKGVQGYADKQYLVKVEPSDPNPPEPIEKLVIFKQSDWDDYCRAIEKILTKAT